MNIYHASLVDKTRHQELVRNAEQERLATLARGESKPFWQRLGIRIAMPRLRPVAIRPVSTTEARPVRATR